MAKKEKSVYKRIERVKRDHELHQRAIEAHVKRHTISSAENLVAGHKIDTKKRDDRRARYAKKRWHDIFIATDGSFRCSSCNEEIAEEGGELRPNVRIRYRKPTSRRGPYAVVCGSCFAQGRCRNDQSVRMRIGSRVIVFDLHSLAFVRRTMNVDTATPRVIEEWITRLIDENLDG